MNVLKNGMHRIGLPKATPVTCGRETCGGLGSRQVPWRQDQRFIRTHRERSNTYRWMDASMRGRVVRARVDSGEGETDVVVVGSGIGGLCCAALLARYGYSVTVCEAHYHAGGAAHGFDVDGYTFDAGPSFFAGLSGPPGNSTNPLKQVLDAVGESVECVTYDTWITYTPEGTFPCVCNRDEYVSMIQRMGGETAYRQWCELEQRMKPLQKGASLFPAAAIRSDLGIIVTAMQLGPGLLSTAFSAKQLTGPFSDIVDPVVTDPWLRNFLDLECFVLSGMKAKDTIAAEMAFMFMERNGGSSTIDYPIGGSGAIVDALVRGIEKYGGRVMLSSPVDKILMDRGKAVGVSLKKGKTSIMARRAVVSNASVWDTASLLQASSPPGTYDSLIKDYKRTPTTGSFMHLHLGINAEDLPKDLECHHLVVNDWSDIESPQNVCIASIPTVFDPSLAPPGKAVVHCYTAGNEPWDIWKNVKPGTPEYAELKHSRTQCLWNALERVIPDIRDRAELVLEGTPHTHARFLRRHQGTYGPAISARTSSFPGPVTPVPQLYRCGDSCQPGIGVPAAAASGMILANTLAPIHKHLDMIRQLKLV